MNQDDAFYYNDDNDLLEQELIEQQERLAHLREIMPKLLLQKDADIEELYHDLYENVHLDDVDEFERYFQKIVSLKKEQLAL